MDTRVLFRQQPDYFEVQPGNSPHASFSNERKGRTSLLPLPTGAVGKGLQLLLSQPLLLLQVLLPDEQRGLGLDEAPVVLQLLGGQLARQEAGDQVLPAVQVILQVFGVLPLLAQQTVAVVQRLLGAGRGGRGGAESKGHGLDPMQSTCHIHITFGRGLSPRSNAEVNILQREKSNICIAYFIALKSIGNISFDVIRKPAKMARCYFQTARGQFYHMSTEGRVDRNVIETGPQFR